MNCFNSFRLETSSSKSGAIEDLIAMTDMKDASETLNSSEDYARLQKEIDQLKQDNKVLHIRAQGVQVLGMQMIINIK